MNRFLRAINLGKTDIRKTGEAEMTYTAEEIKPGFLLYKPADMTTYGKSKVDNLRSADDELLYRVVHMVSGFCIAECERSMVKDVIATFNAINLDTFTRNGDLRGYLDGIEVTMHFNLEHTIEQLDDDVTNN